MSGQRPVPPEEGMPLGVLLRACADGELSPEEQKAAAAHLLLHPEDEARVEFERRLRGACGKTMGGVGAPAGLRERIMRAAASESAAPAGASDESSTHLSATAGRIERGHRSMASSFLSPGRLALYAAAAIAIGAVGVYYMQATSTETLIGQSTSSVQVASFLEREHDLCRRGEAATRGKFTVTDAAAVPDACRGWLGRELSLEQVLAGGVEFVGAGECGVPGPGRSIHLQFRTVGADPKPVSLFVQIFRPDGTELPVDEGVVYTMGSPGGGTPIVVWRRGTLVYHLVADSAEASRGVRQAMGVGEPSRSL